MRNCKLCGALFTPTNGKQVFCSRACRVKFAGLDGKRRKEYVAKPKKQYHPGVVSCLKCDKVFNSWDTRINRICPRCSFHAKDINVGVEAYFLETATLFA